MKKNANTKSYNDSIMARQTAEFEKFWTSIHEDLNMILIQYEISPNLLSNAHNKIYHLWRSASDNIKRELYKRISNYITTYIQGLCDRAIHNRHNLLIQYSEDWERFHQRIPKVDHVFLYANNKWGDLNNGGYHFEPVYRLAMNLWRTQYFDIFAGAIVQDILDQITRDRSGQIVNDHIIQTIIYSMIHLGTDPKLTADKKAHLRLYREYFQAPFLESTALFYTHESNEKFNSVDLASYIRICARRKEEEVARIGRYLHPSSMRRTMRELDKAMVIAHAADFTAMFLRLMAVDNIDDITRIFLLGQNIDEIRNPICVQFEEYCSKEWRDIFTEGGSKFEKDNVYVDEIIRLHKKYERYIHNAFRGHAQFKEVGSRLYTRMLNENAICKKYDAAKSAEFLATYTDRLMRSTNVMQVDELDGLLTDIAAVIPYLYEKDVYFHFYTKYISQRLILKTSYSEEIETAMVGRIQSIAGYACTYKWTTMRNDISLAEEMNQQFDDWKLAKVNHLKNPPKVDSDGKPLPIDPYKWDDIDKAIELSMSARVLRSGVWILPAHPLTDFNPPAVIRDGIHLFEKFYGGRHQGRKLLWQFHMSKAEVRTAPKLLDKPYTFQCTTYQAAILDMLNEKAVITYKEIAEHTGLIDELVQNTLKTLLYTHLILSSPPYKMEKQADGITDIPIDRESKFKLNAGGKKPFSHNKIKLNLDVKLKVVKQKEVADGYQAVEEDRRHQVDAAIVRIMKSRKTLKHQLLIAETLEQCNRLFKPTPMLVKKCIESLISRDYLERDAEDSSTYNYLA